MKPLLLFLAVALPLWVYSQSPAPAPSPTVPSAESEKPGAGAAQHENDPPGADSPILGRYQVAMLQGEGGSHIGIRVDTFTGEAWTLNHTIGESKPVEGKPGTSTVKYVDYWKPCLEPAAMEAVEKRNSARAAAGGK